MSDDIKKMIEDEDAWLASQPLPEPINPDDMPPDVLESHAVPDVIQGSNADEPEIDWDEAYYEAFIRIARGGK